MEITVDHEGGPTENRGFTLDGSVDMKGRPVLTSKTGRWRACFFLIGYEAFERMAFYGIAANLVVYLTTELREGTISSARNVNNWSGAVWITPILGAYVADSHFGRYWTFVVSSVIYVLGMGLLTLAVSLKALRPGPCEHSQKEICEKASPLHIGFFYFSLYILAVGNGGTKPNISTFGADQFDDFNRREKVQKNSFFNWWMFSVFFGALVAQTVLVYIQDQAGWGLGYGIPTAGLSLSLIIFLLGTPYYRHKVPKDGPVHRVFRVFVAAARNWRLRAPADPSLLYELDPKEYLPARGKRRIFHTPVLRFLDKAATKVEHADNTRLCTVTQVEETKLMIGMLPVWLATVIPSTILAQVNTLFVKQGITMDRHIEHVFQIPAASLGAFITIPFLISVPIYDRYLVPLVSRHTGNPRGITLLQRLGTGCLVQVLVMIVACATEAKRVHVIRQRGLANTGGIVPMSIFWLLPQYILLGIADVFTTIAMLEFFYDQSPGGMQSLGTALFSCSMGVGNFVSSFLLTAVTKITGRDRHRAWIQNNLNASHLHYYYALLAVLSLFNTLFFVLVSRVYAYKKESHEGAEGDAISLPVSQGSAWVARHRQSDFVSGAALTEGSYGVCIP